MDLLSFIFPKKCVGCQRFGAYLCSNCFALIEFSVSSVCAVCSRPSLDAITHPLCRRAYDIDGVITGVVYKGVIKKMLYQFKFQPYVSNIRTVVAELFYESIIQQEVFSKIDKTQAALTPIPLSEKKLRNRGYNQSELLARDMAERLSLPFLLSLKRTQETPSQVGKTQSERQANVRGVFSSVSAVAGTTVFLVDDIVTSGATMNEAARTLKRAGARQVWGLAFAHGK